MCLNLGGTARHVHWPPAWDDIAVTGILISYELFVILNGRQK